MIFSLLGWSLIVQGAELAFLGRRRFPILFSGVLLFIFSVLLIVAPNVHALPILLCTVIFLRFYFGGPFNGGADAMTFITLFGLCGAKYGPVPWSRAFLALIAAQLVLSYFIAGVVKARHRSWWTGEELRKILTSTDYQFPAAVASFAHHARAMKLLSWIVLLFELSFPLALLGPAWASFYCGLGLLFHAGNAWALGLNRFLWAWAAAYPVLWAL